MHGTKNLHLVGIGLRGGRGTRGQGFLLGREEAAGFLRQAVASTPGVEASILSTWNRKEFYLAAPLGRSPAGRWWEDLYENQTGLSGAGADIYSYQANGVEVGRHLIRLACGLDSHGAGDTEVLRELRGAMELSAECGTLGGHLGRIFTHAACVGTRVRREIRGDSRGHEHRGYRCRNAGFSPGTAHGIEGYDESSFSAGGRGRTHRP